MKSTKKFSRFILAALALIMGISFILTATGIFLYRIDKLEKSADAMLDLSQRGFGNTLARQLKHVGDGLVHVVSDAAIQEFIADNDWYSLYNTIKDRYISEPMRRLFIYDSRNHRFIPELPGNLTALEPVLETLSTQDAGTKTFQRADDDTFITTYSIPMLRGDSRIATAYLLYDISVDPHFWELVHNSRLTLSRILIKTDDQRLFNLRTGEEVDFPDKGKAALFSDTGATLEDIFPGEALLPVSSFPGLYYAGYTHPIDEQIKAVKIILVYLCILIVLITLCVSFFISKVVSRPLERMAGEALQIARDPSNVTLDEEKVEYLEFKQLAHAFNQVLLALFSAQEKLKADAGEEKKRLEEELHRAMKMEAIGAMAGGVAHDLNNILSGLVSYPDLLLMDLPESSPLRKPILKIQKSGEKAAAIVQDMLTLARRNVNVTEVVNLNSILQEYLKSPEHQRTLSYNPAVNLTTDLEPNLLNMVGSDVHLSKTLMNLVSNAMEAMPDGGEIRITTRNEYVDIPIAGYDTVNEGDYIVLTVSDNGIGIEPEDREKIFEPFYTKKIMGRSGTGLGMAVVWGAIKDHNGYIDLRSEVNVGTSFTLYFPVTRKELLEHEADSVLERYAGKGETVLVVDDIAEQRNIAAGMLTRLGYQVATVSSGEKAVAHIQAHPVDILVLDMIMTPGIDGLETYRRILEVRPDQRAIVASGFSETARVRKVQEMGAGAYVKKPYLMKNIGPAIRRALDA
jgi:signal transduction histidine kinase